MIEFVFSQSLDGKVLKSIVFTEDDLKNMMQGIYYAKVKDFYKPRKDAYVKNYHKLYELLKWVE